MWPWGHFGAAYLLFSLYRRGSPNAPDVPSGGAVALVALGSQFPDVVDKPLAWYLAVLPNGRSLAHSAITATVVAVVVLAVAHRYDRRDLGVAFVLGYYTHLVTDGLYEILTLDVEMLAYLAWPLAPPIEYSTGKSFAAHLGQLQLSPRMGVQLVLAALAVAVWYRQGMPGLARLHGGRTGPGTSRGD